MNVRPSADVRRQVAKRANERCEYCLIHQDDALATHQIDHVVAEKHGGPTTSDNLALACILCNLRKGSDLSSIDPETGEVARLFDPRSQNWSDHFRIEDVYIVGTTANGRATVQLLQLNSFQRLAERRELRKAGRFPAGF
ncbi:MAG: HNH endonuclease [Pirellulaceae bacterium]|nr:HNH endonuclease [Pirellulaceae bacterium]